MKSYYMVVLLLAVSTVARAQRDVQVPQVPREHYKAFPMIRHAESMPEVESLADPTRASRSSKFNPEAALRMTYYEEVIGLTRYDLQMVSAENRLAKTGQYMSAAFMLSLQDVDYTDRGTGYNFYGVDGSWEEELPYERIEDVRVGYPSIMHTAGGKEVVIAHDGTLDLYMVSRYMNSGDEWAQEAIPNPSGRDLLFPKACSGGMDGNSIHLIVITEPIVYGGSEYEGLDGALLYYRSTDQGATWDIQGEILPGTDSLSFLSTNPVSAYFIVSRGDKVAFAVFSEWADSYVMISEDNGDTWTKRILVDFPVDLYVIDTGIDLNGDALSDTLYGTDGSGTVLIDADGLVHAWWGDMLYLDDDLTDASGSYFPGTNGISYWNESYADNESYTITGAPDIDGNGTLDLEDDGAAIPLYYTSLSGIPSASLGEDGTIYLTFSGIMESHDNGDQNFRHIFIVSSEDGGETWLEEPIDLTPDLDFDGYEYVFCSLAPTADDKIHMIFQRDTEPGLHVWGDEDPADDNDIVYYCITTDLVVEPNVYEEFVANGITAYPNPANDQLNVVVKGLQGGVVSLINSIGEVVVTERMANDIASFDVNELAAGMYTVQVNDGTSIRTTQVVVK